MGQRSVLEEGTGRQLEVGARASDAEKAEGGPCEKYTVCSSKRKHIVGIEIKHYFSKLLSCSRIDV